MRAVSLNRVGYLLLLCLSLTAAVGARAQTCSLQPYSASYRTYINKLPMGVKARMQLVHVKDDIYRMTFTADTWLLHNKEQSTFHWNNGDPRTITYIHEFNGMGFHRYYHMQFDWDHMTITDHSEKRTKTYPLKPGTVDEITMFLKARCLLAAGAKHITEHDAYGDDMRTQEFDVTGHETIKTPYGKVDAIRLRKKRDEDKSSIRRTEFWVAPKLNYTLARVLHVENFAVRGEMNLKDYSGPLLDSNAVNAGTVAKDATSNDGDQPPQTAASPTKTD